MTQGRPRLPIEVLKAKGTYRKDRHGDIKEFSTDELPLIGDPPDHLSTSEQGVWQELREAAVPGVLRRSDSFFLEITTRLLDQYRRDPDMKVGLLSQLTKCLGQMGFGAMDRLKMGVTPPEKPAVNPFATMDR